MFIPTDTNMGGNGGLASLMSGPPKNPLERPGASAVLALLGQHPDLSPDFVQNILGMLGGNIAGRQQAKQDTRTAAFDTASQGLMGYAGSGYATPEGLSALSSSYQSMSPSLQGPNISGRLSDLTSNLGDFAATVPGAESAGPEPLTSDDFAIIDEDVTAWASGEVKQPNGLPMGLHEAVLAHVQALRAQGYPEDVLDRVARYIEQKWIAAGGPGVPGAAPTPNQMVPMAGVVKSGGFGTSG